MTHIKTKSDAEEANRKLYKKAAETTITASEKQVKTLQEIVDLVRQSDELQLQISTKMGELMGYMQDNYALIGADGRELVVWKNGSDKKTVDYKQMILDMNIPPQTLQRYTKVTPGARVFTINDENF